MAGYLIKDTTRQEREQIVADSLGNIDAYCDEGEKYNHDIGWGLLWQYGI